MKRQKHGNLKRYLDIGTFIFLEDLLDFKKNLSDSAGLHFINLCCAVHFRRYIVINCCNLLSATLTFCFVYFLNHFFLISHNSHSDCWQPPESRLELVALSCGLYEYSRWDEPNEREKASLYSFLVGSEFVLSTTCLVAALHCGLLGPLRGEMNTFYKWISPDCSTSVQHSVENKSLCLLKRFLLSNCIVAALHLHQHDIMSHKFGYWSTVIRKIHHKTTN